MTEKLRNFLPHLLHHQPGEVEYDQKYFAGGRQSEGVQFPEDGAFLNPNSHYRYKAIDLLRTLNIDQGGLVVDAGSGPGHIAYWAKQLELPFSVVSCDISMFASQQARIHDHSVRASVYELPFKKECLIGIIFSDVLEHVSPDNAVQAVRSGYEMLQIGGRLLINIPNFFTWSDAAKKDMGHVWLPAIGEVRTLLEQAGFINKPRLYTRGFPLSNFIRKNLDRDLRLPFLGRSIQAVVEK